MPGKRAEPYAQLSKETYCLLFSPKSILHGIWWGILCLLLIRFPVSAQQDMQTIWQLAYWESYDTACTIVLDVDRTPNNDEIHRSCGDVLYQSWLTTPVCNRHYGQDPSAVSCTGLFLRRVGQKPKEDPINTNLIDYQAQNLRQIRFDVSNVNCQPGQLCDQKPEILLIAHGPDNNDGIISSVHIRIGTYEAACDGNACQMRMPATDASGVWFEYWAMDSGANQSDHFWLKFRAVPAQNSSSAYYYDVIGDAFPDNAYYGSDVWYTFPSLTQVPALVLEKVPTVDYLVTKHKLQLLGAKLIRSGKVDASFCENYGLNLDGTPNGCGEQVTAKMVFDMQNQYDELIYDYSAKQKVPPRIVKGLIAQESQFWPYSETPYEYGLGMLTESGADMLLRWNSPYFLKVCMNTYPHDQKKCMGGFSNLDESEQIVLRGVVISKVGSDEEIEVLAAAIRGSVYQVNQIVTNVMGDSPAAVSTYEDMWKFTVANYYSGSGCLYNAINQVAAYSQPITWENVRRFLTGKCELANLYVDRVYELGY